MDLLQKSELFFKLNKLKQSNTWRSVASAAVITAVSVCIGHGTSDQAALLFTVRHRHGRAVCQIMWEKRMNICGVMKFKPSQVREENFLKQKFLIQLIRRSCNQSKMLTFHEACTSLNSSTKVKWLGALVRNRRAWKYSGIPFKKVTRMHSSRMHTARTMTVGGGEGLGEIYFILIL